MKGGLGTLMIYNASEQDVGEFQCIARNRHGKSLSKIAQLVMGVHKSFPKMDDEILTPFLGADLTLHCHPPQNMTPPPRVWWTADEDGLVRFPESNRVTMDYTGKSAMPELLVCKAFCVACKACWHIRITLSGICLFVYWVVTLSW